MSWLDAAAAATLTIVAVLAVRVLLRPAVRREIAGQPLFSAAGAGLLGAGIWAAVLLARSVPNALPLFAAIALIVALLLGWRARPSFGTSRGLPPGSLGFGHSLDAISQSDFYAKQAGRFGPVFKMAQFHRPVVCIVDLPTGLEVLDREGASLAQPRLPFGRLSPGNYIEFMNDERHTRYRAILKPAFSGRVVADAKIGLEAATGKLLRSMVVSDPRGVAPEPALATIAFAGLVHAIFGITVEDPRFGSLKRWFDDLGSPRAFAERRPEERREPYQHLVEVARGLGRDMLSNPSLDPATPSTRSALGEIVRADRKHLDDDTVIGNLVLMAHVTRSNVRGLLAWVLKEYSDHPEWASRLRAASPSGPQSRDALATCFVNETLRLHQSEYFYREAVRPIEIGRFRIPKGWLVRVCVRECHDRPDLFPNPDRFDPTRFLGRQFSRTEYCPFSDGSHSCFGAGLAVTIAKVLLTVLATDYEVHTIEDGPVIRDGNRHWSHWRPSRRFRISLVSRPA